MKVDCNMGGGIDGTCGADLDVLADQVAVAEQTGFDGVWSTEVSRDPFLPLVLAADRSSTLQLGTSVAVAFARNPMSTAVLANDLNTMSNGRFVLGLGSQIQAHITRRFSMPWSAPVDRMREYLHAMRAIWRSWETGEKLEFCGQHYRHTLMTPMFTPQPNPYGPPKVMLAAVGPKMTSLAAEATDGLLVHGFTTQRYLREVTVPVIQQGLCTSGRTRGDFTLCYPGLVATGVDDEQLSTALNQVRQQIAFYGATPAYRAVLDLHGWTDLHVELHALSKVNDWEAMTRLIDDDILNTFAVVGDPKAVAEEVVHRFGELIDRFTLYTPYPLDDATKADIVEGIKAASSVRQPN